MRVEELLTQALQRINSESILLEKRDTILYDVVEILEWLITAPTEEILDEATRTEREWANP